MEDEIDNEKGNKTVFISGLPYEATEEDIKSFFQNCGGIKEIKIPKYQDSGRNIGYGHVSFKKNKAVNRVIIYKNQALELNGTNLGKRYITVKLSNGENAEKSLILLIQKQEKQIQWIYLKVVKLYLLEIYHTI